VRYSDGLTSLSAKSRRLHKLDPFAVAVLALSAGVCVLWMVHGWGYVEDDGWIHLEFARSVAAGRGFSFNGHVVYGDTSPLWVWLLVAMHALVPGWTTATKLLDVLGCAFTLAAVLAFGRSLTRSLPPAQSLRFAALGVLIFVTGPYFGYWSFSGMEAVAACGLTATACTLIARRKPSPTVFLLTALCGGIAPILRPEMSFLSVLLGLALLFRLVRMNASPTTKAALFVAGLGLLALPFGMWARYAVHTFGTVLPNTNAAKRAGPGDSVVRKLVSIYGFGFPEILVAGVGLGLWSLRAFFGKRFEQVRALFAKLGMGALVLVLWIVIAVVFYLADHTYVQTRYIMVNAPLLAIVLFAAVALVDWTVYRVGVVLTVVFGVALSALTTWPLVRNKVAENAVVAQLASYLQKLPENAAVADYSIGEIAFLSEHPIVDTGGITRPGMIAYLWDRTPERQLAWMRSQGARYIVGEQPEAGAQLVWSHDVAPVGWNLHPSAYRAVEQLQLWTIPPGPDDPAKMVKP
jgi:hypothetical protein